MTDTTTIPAPTPPTEPPTASNRAAVPPPGRARAFTAWIDRRSHDDPGVRSALRRGVGKPVDKAPFMHRYVAAWLSEEQLRDRDVERAHYTVAALIAAQRRDQYAAAAGGTGPAEAAGNGETGADSKDGEADGAGGGSPQTDTAVRPGRSLGRSLADGVAAGLREASVETKLNLLTRQSVEGLHRHLPAAVRQLRERGVDVDWAQLLVDLCRWRRHSGAVKRRWLQDYYRAVQAGEERAAREADKRDSETTGAGTDAVGEANDRT
ncbi:type I-E CRISPR-associated protein Cse2/CasB [Kitasatospora sp. NPDC006786]|uniref:type I-E CRISPR-associated protein Cse2/CasB n=1 Tax=unclassified Kitasatospora TaxID=2633591 RepID=UPI0033D45C07